MSHCRAVWLEPVNKDGELAEFEMTIPTYWVVGQQVYYPHHLNVKRSYNNMEHPKDDWKKFRLVKIKVRGGKTAKFLLLY